MKSAAMEQWPRTEESHCSSDLYYISIEFEMTSVSLVINNDGMKLEGNDATLHPFQYIGWI